jgi:hypothetical protein
MFSTSAEWRRAIADRDRGPGDRPDLLRAVHRSAGREPFDGPGEVVVRRLPSRSVAGCTTVLDSGFRVAVGPGRYSVKVIPYPDDPRPPCWVGSKKKVVLDAGELARPKLTVTNRCVL